MLVGFNLATLDVGSIEEGDFFVRFKIRCKKEDFISNLIFIYGPAQEDHKQKFLTELAHLSSKETLPMLIGDDFNIMRGPQEKSKVIDAYNLRELDLSGRQFTWANNLAHQTFEKLDRVLVTTEWETKYPKATVQAVTREISDHTPLFLNSGDGDSISPHSDFKFELGWQAKIRRLRQHLRGWAKNVGGAYKKEKKVLLDKLDELDKKSEHTQLDYNELNLKHALHERVTQLLREEEIKWYQRDKVKNLLEGDANTKFFHPVANDVVLDGNRLDDIPQVSPQENVLLSAPFTVEEVRSAIFQMEHNKAPRPDGFPSEFY
ncbi:hypothetical protein U9M48_036931 [Paspalum notatum var. saurae]|uniref:Endonuclease/exonuclease/phosphatase domain-containing protein n=1 Tax=Paspalum notatum var. saurae TaxID=547442 RepID=A0AAQ3UIK8_PASNO